MAWFLATSRLRVSGTNRSANPARKDQTINKAYATPSTGPVSSRKVLTRKIVSDGGFAAAFGSPAVRSAAACVVVVDAFDTEEPTGVGAGVAVAVGAGDGTGVGVAEAAGVGVVVGVAAGDGLATADAGLPGVWISGKTDPFRIPAANNTKSRAAKIPPYTGERDNPVQPLFSAARLKRASPSLGAL